MEFGAWNLEFYYLLLAKVQRSDLYLQIRAEVRPLHGSISSSDLHSNEGQKNREVMWCSHHLREKLVRDYVPIDWARIHIVHHPISLDNEARRTNEAHPNHVVVHT